MTEGPGAGAGGRTPSGSRSAFAVQGVAPDRLIQAAGRDEVVEALRAASAGGGAVEPAGAGGWLGRGRPPERLDAVLSVARLDGIDPEPGDLTVSVGAGARLSAVQAALAEVGQWVALSGPGAAAGTVGALVATGTAGPLRLAYGTPRDQVLGAELVTGDGRALAVGGRVVKNVAGYDVTRVLVGSMGTLGVLTRVHLRVHPRPDADSSWSVGVGSVEEATGLAESARAARVPLAALEVVSPAAASRLGLAGSWTVLARALGPAELVAAAGAALRGLGPRPEPMDPGAWRALSALEAESVVAVRLAQLPSSLGETVAAALRLLEAGWGVGGESALLAAHAGDGIVRALWPGPGRGSVDDATAAVEAARSALRRGTVVVDQSPPALARALDPWGGVGDGRRLMSRLKDVFDPAGVLAPGRFVV